MANSSEKKLAIELMEIQYSFQTLFSFVLLIVLLLKLLKRSPWNSNTPPGPRKLPIIGNMHQLMGSPPHHALRDLAKQYGPLMQLQLGEVSSIIVSSPEMAREVMKTHDLVFATRPKITASKIMSYDSTDIAFAPYGKYWRQLRKICTLELLSMKRVQSFQSIREEEMSNMMEWIRNHSGKAVNLSRQIFSSSYGLTSRVAFGKKCEEQEKFVSVVTEAMKLAAGFDIADVFPSISLLPIISGSRKKLERLQKEADRILQTIIHEHGAKRERKSCYGGEDLVDVLMKFVENEDLDFSLSTDNIKAVILDVFTAGSETSATSVEWAMAEMMQNPRILERASSEVRQAFDMTGVVEETVLGDLKYFKSVIKETLRCHPPLPLLLPRECSESCKINGYVIPVKSKMIINAWAIGRDPRYWSDPDVFTPERFLDSCIDYKGNHFEYTPFGGGRRICPGIFFGMASLEYQLAMLLYHFDWSLPHGLRNEDLDMTEALGVTARRKNDLYLVPKQYMPSLA